MIYLAIGLYLSLAFLALASLVLFTHGVTKDICAIVRRPIEDAGKSLHPLQPTLLCSSCQCDMKDGPYR